MKIEFVSNFKELNYLEKRYYVEKLPTFAVDTFTNI